MTEEIDFLDLMALKKIEPDTVVEKFGGIINSSFFDASNILGTLKIKDLVDFTSAVIGQNSITVTEKGKGVLADANAKASDPIDTLDHTLLVQLSSGKRSLNDISGAVNIRPKDLAMHLYKLEAQQYITTTFRNGNLDLLLTEKGFSQSKADAPKPAQQAESAPQEQPKPSDDQDQTQSTPPTTPSTPSTAPQTSEPPKQPFQSQQSSTTTTLPGSMQQPSSSWPSQSTMSDMQDDLSKIHVKKSKAPTIIIITIIILLVLIVLEYLNII